MKKKRVPSPLCSCIAPLHIFVHILINCLVPMLYAEKREDWFIDGYGLFNSRISTFLWYSPHYIKILFKILLVDTLDITEKTVLWDLLIWDICVHIYGYCYGCGCACTLSRVPLCATPWTVNCQAPLSMGFLRQEYWSGLPFPSPRDLPDPGIEPRPPSLQADSLPSEPSGKPIAMGRGKQFWWLYWDYRRQ